jgi:hypothetical protein
MSGSSEGPETDASPARPEGRGQGRTAQPQGVLPRDAVPAEAALAKEPLAPTPAVALKAETTNRKARPLA